MITLHHLYILAGAMFAAFAVLSALDARNRKRFGNAAFWGLMAFFLVVYAGNVAGPPPPDERAIAWVALLSWLLPLWAWWADAHREVTPQLPETAYGAVPS